jgi:phosphomevalonate kinase
MLADVDAGSDTPSLVGKVLKWRKEDSATGMFAKFPCFIESHTQPANALWSALDLLNQSLAQTLLKLQEQHSQEPLIYQSCVNALSVMKAAEVRLELETRNTLD